MNLSTTQSAHSRVAGPPPGRIHGPTPRLMSPSYFGKLLKPFVFLDLIDNHGKPFTGFGLHPHSGIATLTYVMEGSLSYEDTNGATGLLAAGGLGWVRGGAGVGMAAALAPLVAREASSFGSHCRPIRSWDHRRASI